MYFFNRMIKTENVTKLSNKHLFKKVPVNVIFRFHTLTIKAYKKPTKHKVEKQNLIM